MRRSDVHAHLQEAIALAQAGQRTEARRLLTRVVEADPDLGLAWMWLATVSTDRAERVEYLERALALDPDNATAQEAYAQLTGNTIDSKLVSMALSELLYHPDEITPEHVIDTVANYYRVTVDSLRSNSRSRTIAFPRQMAMYLVRTETDLSFPQIGDRLGKRDHTTVLYGYEKISELRETDADIRRDILQIKAALSETPTQSCFLRFELLFGT